MEKAKSFLVLMSFLLYGCNHVDHSKKQKIHQPKLSATDKDTLFITTKTAVRATLDSIGLAKNGQKYGDTSVDAYTEDGAYYDYVADSILKQKQLPVKEAINYKFLKFVQKNGRVTIIRIDTLSQISTLFFFDPPKTPHIADVTDIEDDYKSYFSQ